MSEAISLADCKRLVKLEVCALDPINDSVFQQYFPQLEYLAIRRFRFDHLDAIGNFFKIHKKLKHLKIEDTYSTNPVKVTKVFNAIGENSNGTLESLCLVDFNLVFSFDSGRWK